MVQWLRLHTRNAEDLGAIRGQGTSFPQATAKAWHARVPSRIGLSVGTFDTEPPKKPLRTSAGK